MLSLVLTKAALIANERNSSSNNVGVDSNIILVADKEPKGYFKIVSLRVGRDRLSALMFVNLTISQAEHFDICCQSSKTGAVSRRW